MRVLITALLGIAVVTGLILYFGQLADSSPSENNQERNADTSEGSSWQSYNGRVTSEIRFSVEHPPQTTVSQVENTVYEIKYVGPESEQNTEITDGYYATLMFREAPDLETYIEQQNPDTRIQTLPFNGRDGLTFTTKSELGNLTVSHIAYRLFPESDWILDAGYTVHGEQSAKYRDELLDIFGTIRVTSN